MFANFLYLLVALILYTTCQHQGPKAVLADNALLWALFMVVAFTGVCRLTFRRLERLNSLDRSGMDLHMDRALSRLSVLALVMFAVDLYGLRLKLLFAHIRLFQIFPTVEALVFLGLFITHLVIIWVFAWNFQNKAFMGPLSRKSFVISNISFSLPALLPWFFLSLMADIIQILPFEGPKNFLSTPQGEICYVVSFLFAMAAFGPYLIQKLWRCKPLEPGETRDRIQDLCRRAGLKVADILRWELFGGSMITAGVMGIVARFRYILVTPALISLLRPDEIDAVIAHEIGHIQKKHIHFYLFFFAGYIACIYALFDPLLLLLYYSKPLFDLVAVTGMEHETAYTLFISLILISLFLVYFRFVFGFYMRNFERQADLHVYTLLGNASSLVDTFFKIVRFSRQSSDKPNWHHYSISERIGFLRLCEADPSHILRHNKKIRAMILGYIAVMAGISVIGYSLNFGAGKQAFDRFVTGMVIARQVQTDPGNTEMMTLIGDYYYDAKAFGNAVDAYEKVLDSDPGNLHALNNLAWTFATCEDETVRDFPRALALAEMALALDRAAYILDTYAEACFVNGQYDKSLEAAREALAKATDRLEYYREQVRRFEAGAGLRVRG
ncbi:MAG: M48 family metalloprotease [Pseudomonadota bacterium]